jgi:c-di-GMP-binding flagellar brake protein YcgR
MNLPVDNSPQLADPPAQNVEQLFDVADQSEYLLRTKNEILFVLRGLLAATDRITVYFNEGKDYLLTAIIALEDDQVTLDYGSNATMNERALGAERLFCIASHEKVRIQFVLTNLRKVDFEGHPAFLAALPDTLLRLQRRQYYRLTTPIANPLRCLMPLTLPDGRQSAASVNVLDISGGGLSIITPPPGVPFGAGMKFPNCRIELPEVGILTATLEVRNVFEVTKRRGDQVTRAGCQFVNLPGPMLTLVQRYIIKVERERKARETGLT